MATTQCVVKVDLADVWEGRDRKNLLRTLAWGDQVSVVKVHPDCVEVEAIVYTDDDGVETHKQTGFIVPTKSSKIKPSDTIGPAKGNDVLKTARRRRTPSTATQSCSS